MKTLLKWVMGLGFLLLLMMGINGAITLWQDIEPDLTSPDGEYDVLDGLTGNMQVDQYLKVREKSHTFNFPAIRTGILMYMANHGRYPETLDQLTRSGDLSPDAVQDPWGNPFSLQIEQNQATLRSAGKDRIAGTTDDIQHRMNL